MAKRIVIEVYGGVVQNVYSDSEDIEFIIMDHDVNTPEDDRIAFEGEDYYYLGVAQSVDKDTERTDAIYAKSEELTKQEQGEQ